MKTTQQPRGVAHDGQIKKRSAKKKWQRISWGLTLDQIDESLHSEARKAFVDGDATGLLLLADGPGRLPLFFDIWWELLERGIYEPGLIFAYASPALNHFMIKSADIEGLFTTADPLKLLAAGDPLPDGESFVVYRGVAGCHRNRRVEGYSWTLDLSCACWFANRLGFPDPRVYQATVARNDVLACVNSRDEAEIIWRPKGIHNRRLTHREIAARAEEFNMQKKQRRQAANAALV